MVEHEILSNAQSLITISRKRLCNQASPETREAWQELLYSIQSIEYELYNSCVPDCIYRGYCYEHKTCGYHRTREYQTLLEIYRDGINI